MALIKQWDCKSYSDNKSKGPPQQWFLELVDRSVMAKIPIIPLFQIQSSHTTLMHPDTLSDISAADSWL